MTRDPELNCPDCKGQGFYLRHEGHGFYRDGSFGHNQWEDCEKCNATGDKRERLDYKYPALALASPNPRDDGEK